MHTKYDISSSYGSKIIAKVKLDFLFTTEPQTDRPKTQCPRISFGGGGCINDNRF